MLPYFFEIPKKYRRPFNLEFIVSCIASLKSCPVTESQKPLPYFDALNVLPVVGIAGSDEKMKLLKEVGFDAAINYKTTSDMTKSIAELCPNGVDIYFDNVGGEISDAVIANINFHARIALCGQISLYNSTEISVGPRLQPMLLTRSALMQGFIVGNYQSRFPEGIQQLTKWVKENKLTFKETIVHGFDQLPTAFIGLFDGKNIGKMIVEA